MKQVTAVQGSRFGRLIITACLIFAVKLLHFLEVQTVVDDIYHESSDVKPWIPLMPPLEKKADSKKMQGKESNEEMMPRPSTEHIPLWSCEHHERLLELIEHSKETSAPTPDLNMTAAICHKTLFGEIDLWTVIDWAVYHRLLGFDKIVISYTADMIRREGFDLLQSLPFVNLILNVQGYQAVDRVGHFVDQNETVRKNKLSQQDMIVKCLTEDAKDYDWVLLSDADEYLWFNKTIGVKDFLSTFDPNVTYLSFGKEMYTISYTVESAQHRRGPFFLEEYPFFTGKFCSEHSRQNRTCAGAPGRSKVMVKPAHHNWVAIHGFTNDEERYEGAFVVPGQWALLREWRGSNNPHHERKSVMPRETFNINRVGQIHVHSPRQYFWNGTAKVYYDASNKDWFDYVASRGR